MCELMRSNKTREGSEEFQDGLRHVSCSVHRRHTELVIPCEDAQLFHVHLFEIFWEFLSGECHSPNVGNF